MTTGSKNAVRAASDYAGFDNVAWFGAWQPYGYWFPAWLSLDRQAIIPALTGAGDGMHCGCISACHLSCSLMALTNMQTPGILYL